jgi:predicted lipid-binding transport protein (Tim44 family)
MAFDPLNLLLLAVALIIFWRLRSVLGSRTGAERPPKDIFGTAKKSLSDKPEPNGKVLRFPPSEDAKQPQTGAEAGDEGVVPVWKGYAEEGTPLAAALDGLAAADRTFTPQNFIEGAKVAYEMIIEAYARGDKATLSGLLSGAVYDGFARVIDERERSGSRIESRFVGIDKAAMTWAELQGNRATITMRFVSELISATYDHEGKLVDGDPREIREVTDVWTFERDISSRNPNWKLTATQAPA